MSHKIVIETLKHVLKVKKINYKTLGTEIGLSESGVKKLFTAKDISVGRLTQICDTIGISISDILTLAKEEEIKNVRLTHKQENMLYDNPLLFRIFWRLAIEERSPQEVQKLEKLQSQQLEKCLLKLENIDLIKVNKKREIISVHKGLYRWIGDSKLLNKINKEWSYNTLDKTLNAKEDPNYVHRLSFLKLSPSTRNQFYQELNDLVDNYARKSQREKLDKPNSELAPLSLLISLAPTDFLS